MPPEHPPRYPVRIPAGALINPPDLSSVTAIAPNAEITIYAHVTEEQFPRLCAGDMRDYLCLKSASADGYDIFVYATDIMSGENSPSFQDACIQALLNRDYPDCELLPAAVAKTRDNMSIRVLDFLISLVDLIGDASNADDHTLLERMASHEIVYDDLATPPPPAG